MSLALKDINFGKTDAYNEFLANGDELFKNSFYCHPSLQLEKILNGEIYYICGNKGTGKTMLLKYIELKLMEIPYNNIVKFIRFKKDIDESDRNSIKRASVPSNGFEEIIDKNIPNDANIDSVLAWEVYLIKVIIKLVSQTEQGIFDRQSETWIKLNKLINLIYKEDTVNIHKILPKIKRGKIEIEIAKILKIGVELDWDQNDKTGIPFNILGKIIVELYRQLPPATGKLYVIIDELELALNKNKSYTRDITLIRDLIFAIQYLSEESKLNSYPIFFIAAIRNEVYKHLCSIGTEINKPISDFGIQITWQQKGGNIDGHPLIQLLEQKIRASEHLQHQETQNLWETYFAPTINSTPVKKYLLDQTWLKPRDVIRMFNCAQKLCPNKSYIDQECFDTIRQQYSEECWIELAEELRAKDSDKEVEGIKQCLIGLTLPFSKKEFEDQIASKTELYEEVELLNKKERPISFILKDIYDVGIIGNYRPGRFYFMGDYDFDPTILLTVHYPLQKFFKNSFKYYK